MKIIVMGAGVVGTATAYYLARDGHEVTVVERHSEPAMGTSFSNAGLLSPGDATSWASPAALRTFIRSLYTPDLGIKVRWRLDPYFLVWSLRFLSNCTRARANASTDAKLRLALYSNQCLNQLVADTGISYDGGKGIIYFFRSQESLDAGVRSFGYLAERGLEIEVVGPDGIVALEPGLAAAKAGIAGGIYSPTDQTGDSRQFAVRLADWAGDNLGVRFVFDTLVEGVETEGDRVTSVKTSAGQLPCETAVVCMGPESGIFGRRLRIDLPIYPVKGYTATIPLRSPKVGPTMGGVDEDRLVAYSRLGNRLRLASTAEFAGFDRTHRPADFAAIFRTAKELFPGAIDEGRAEMWAGLRPMMPGSVPVIGQARYRNLYLNTGHGHVGWTMASGSGKLLADLVAGRKPDIDPRGLGYGG